MIKRKVQQIIRGSGLRWVGNGFHVNGVFSYTHNQNISPFLLLDYASPTLFPPSNTQLGVEFHPHRGFETVTIVYSGEVEHRDTEGNKGKISSGDVQWMTAARGILHEEKHSVSFAQKGGIIEMVQLWVNLPAKDKMSVPRYQEILKETISVVSLNNNMGEVRVIAGHYAGVDGAAITVTPVHLYDICLKAGALLEVDIEPGFNAMLFILNGTLTIESEKINTNELAILTTKEEVVALEVEKDSKLLFMSGEPIEEPIVGMGPFVMNTKEEIEQAYSDFHSGKFK